MIYSNMADFNTCYLCNYTQRDMGMHTRAAKMDLKLPCNQNLISEEIFVLHIKL